MQQNGQWGWILNSLIIDYTCTYPNLLIIKALISTCNHISDKQYLVVSYIRKYSYLSRICIMNLTIKSTSTHDAHGNYLLIDRKSFTPIYWVWNTLTTLVEASLEHYRLISLVTLANKSCDGHSVNKTLKTKHTHHTQSIFTQCIHIAW